MEGHHGNCCLSPWNKGKIVGQKAPFKPKEIWALRVRLQMENRVRELALLTLGIDTSCAVATYLHPKSATSAMAMCAHRRKTCPARTAVLTPSSTANCPLTSTCTSPRGLLDMACKEDWSDKASASNTATSAW